MIKTKRMVLKPLTYKELGILLDNRPDSLGEISLAGLTKGDIPRRPVEIKREKMRALPQEEHIWCTYFLMIDHEMQKAVGMLGFKGVPVDGEVEVGYGTAESCRGRGYMSEALGGLLDWAAGTGRCRKVTADTHVDNTTSQRVLHKCGFIRGGESGEMVHFGKVLG